MQFRKLIHLCTVILLGSIVVACGGGGGGGDSGDTPEPTPTPIPTPSEATAGLMVTTETSIPSPIRIDADGVVLTQRLTAVNNLEQQIKLQNDVTDTPVIISSIDVPSNVSMTQIMSDDACHLGQSLALQQSCVLSYEVKLKEQTPQQINDQIVIHTNSQTTPEIIIPVQFEAKAATANNFPSIQSDAANTQPKFTIGGHYSFEIKNDSQKTMNYLKLVIADWLLPYVENVVSTTTGNLLPGQSALLSFDIKDDEAAFNAIKTHESSMLTNASNGDVIKVTSVNALDIFPNIVPIINPLVVSESTVNFTMPSALGGDKEVTLENVSNQQVSLKALTFSGVTGVSIADSSTCKSDISLAPNSSCTLVLQASDDAKISAQDIADYLQIPYQLSNSSMPLSQQLNINVAKTMINSDNVVDVFSTKKTQIHHITIENKGSFSWYPSSQVAQYQIQAEGDTDSVKILATGDNSCLSLSTAGVKPGETCQLYFQGGDDSLTDQAYHIVVDAADSNLSQTVDLGAYVYKDSAMSINVVQPLPASMIKGQTAYTKVMLTNLSDSNQTYSKLNFLTDTGTGNIAYLSDTSESYPQCVTDGTATLAPNQSCYYKVSINYPESTAYADDRLKMKSQGSGYTIDESTPFTLLSSDTQTANLTQAGSQLPILTTGHTTYIEIQNTSTAAINGLHIKIPGWASDIIETASSHLAANDNILPGESYIFSFKIKDTQQAMDILQAHENDIAHNTDSEQVTDSNAFEFNGANVKMRINFSTNIAPFVLSESEVTINQAHQPTLLNMAKVSSNVAGVISIDLTNLKDQSSTYQFDDSKLPYAVHMGGTCDLSAPDTIVVAGNGSCQLDLTASQEAYNQSTDEGIMISDPVTGISKFLRITIPKTKVTQTNESYVYQRGQLAYVFVKNIGAFNWHVSANSNDYSFLGSDIDGLKLIDVANSSGDVNGYEDCRVLSQTHDGVAPDQACYFPIDIGAQTQLGNYEFMIKPVINLGLGYNQGFSIIKNTGAMSIQDVDGVNQLYSSEEPLGLSVNGETKALYLKNVGIDSIHNIQMNVNNTNFMIESTTCDELMPTQSCQINIKANENVADNIQGELTISASDAAPASITIHLRTVPAGEKRWVWLTDLTGTPNLYSWQKNGAYICDDSMTIQQCANQICTVDPDRPLGENRLDSTYKPHTGDYRAWISNRSKGYPEEDFDARDNVGLSEAAKGKLYYTLSNDGLLFTTSKAIENGEGLVNALTKDKQYAFTATTPQGVHVTPDGSYWKYPVNMGSRQTYGDWSLWDSKSNSSSSSSMVYINKYYKTFRALGQTDLTSADSWTMDEYDLDSSMKTNYANNTLGVRSSNKRHLICFER